MIKWKALVRDVVIIFVLTGLGGFVVGIASQGRGVSAAAVGLANIIGCTVGFTISGCLTRTKRFEHLGRVGFAVWLLSIYNVLLLGVNVLAWFLGIVVITVTALVGGGISCVLAPGSPQETAEPVGDHESTNGQVSSPSDSSGSSDQPFA